MSFAVFLVVAFLVSSIPTGLLLARRLGVDLRTVGSGNIGTANAARALGKKWGAVVLLLDAGKGALAVGFAGAWFSASHAAIAGFVAVLGQVFSVFLKGRGGKGVATSLGAGLTLAPLPALCSAGIFVALYGITRVAAVGSLSGIWTFPIFLGVLGGATPFTLGYAFAVVALVTFRHRDNLRRLRAGTENKV